MNMAKTSDKHFYVTSSIPYINGEPHLGHAMEFVMADVLARYARKRGYKTMLSIGTDEHGGKIAEKATEMKLEPKELADQMSAKFRDLAKELLVANDRFIRTTDEGHVQRAQIIWKSLEKNIYKGKYSGWYCTGCEEYKSEGEVKENGGKCPDHNRPYERLEEENYFFRLSDYKDQIIKAINSGDFKIVPNTRKNEVLQILKDIKDISVSRPKDKIRWGVAVPGDENQVMYVWFEALMNYITVLGYPEHADFKTFWPADIHVIGKGISRFHAITWPGMLLGLGLELPKVLYIHGYITVNNQKMSKSLGNSVSPDEIINKYSPDAFRYFFLRHIPSYEDGDFSWERFEASYNNELANELGNTVNRTAAMILRYQEGAIGQTPGSEHDMGKYHESMMDCRFDRALDEVWEQIRGLNQYIDEEKPWEIAKNETEHLQEVLAYMVSCLLEIAELLEPLLPDTAQKIKSIFASGVVKPIEGTLFPKNDPPAPAQ